MSVLTRHLNQRQLEAIRKIGDSLIEGDADLPSFSASGCIASVDRILDYMPEQDLRDLRSLLTLFSFLPCFLVAVILRVAEWGPLLPGAPGAMIRLIRMGPRGLIMSLYYSEPRVLKAIGYGVTVYVADQENVVNR